MPADGRTAVMLRRLAPVAILALIMALVFTMGWHRYLSLETLVHNRSALDSFIMAHFCVALAAFVAVLCYTGVTVANMGREFMPELEEGNLMVRGTFPVNVSLAEVTQRSRQLRAVLLRFPEFAVILPAIGRPDDGTDPTGYYNVETFLPLRPEGDWPGQPGLGPSGQFGQLVSCHGP